MEKRCDAVRRLPNEPQRAGFINYEFDVFLMMVWRNHTCRIECDSVIVKLWQSVHSQIGL